MPQLDFSLSMPWKQWFLRSFFFFEYVLAFIKSMYSVFAHSLGAVMITLCFGGCFSFPVYYCLFRKVYHNSHNTRNELHIGFMLVFVIYTWIFNLQRQEEHVFSQLKINLKNILHLASSLAAL